MVRYYLLAFASQKVERVYWHQLVAPGYGLVDNRKGMYKRSAFTAFKTMHTLLTNMSLLSFEQKNSTFTLVVKNSIQTITVKWSLDLQIITYNTPQNYVDRDGKSHLGQNIEIGPSPIYFIEEN